MNNTYTVTYKGIKLDLYRIIELYGITHPAHAHVAKKILRCGKTHKSLKVDIQESIDTLERWKQMISEDEDDQIDSKYDPCPICHTVPSASGPFIQMCSCR